MFGVCDVCECILQACSTGLVSNKGWGPIAVAGLGFSVTWVLGTASSLWELWSLPVLAVFL